MPTEVLQIEIGEGILRPPKTSLKDFIEGSPSFKAKDAAIERTS